ncbi:unnamed protein product, partial [Laminaria digitata]
VRRLKGPLVTTMIERAIQTLQDVPRLVGMQERDPFLGKLLFGRSPRTTLDMLVPQMDDTEATGGLGNFIENRRHNMREVAEALKKIHKDKEVARQRRNAG